MFRTIALSVLLTFPLSALAQVNGYQDCLQRVRKDPKSGLTDALQWRDLGGGPPALHCVALAYVANGDYRIAAAKIEELAVIVEGSNKAAAGEVMAQAGSVWLRAKEDARAEAAFAKALTWRPKDARIMIDLALAQIGRKNFEQAMINVNRALEQDDLMADAYALKGMLLRRLNNLVEADEATATALALDPAQPQARMEQALSMARGGDREAARNELAAIIRDYPEGDIAETAQRMLQDLEAK